MYMRPRSTPAPPAKAELNSARISSSRPRHSRFRRKRRNPKRRDAIAMLTLHTKAKAVERKALPDLRDRTRLMNDKPRDRGRFVVGKFPVHHAVQFAHSNR